MNTDERWSGGHACTKAMSEAGKAGSGECVEGSAGEAELRLGLGR